MKKLKIAFVTSTFPSKENPTLGIFNYRSIRLINDECDVTVFKLRIWKPFKPLFNKYDFEGIAVVEVYVPSLPFMGIIFNFIYVAVSYLLLKFKLSALKFDLIYSSFYTTSGLACSLLSKSKKIPHVAHIIGSDVNFDLPLYLKFGLNKNLFIRGTASIVSVSHALKEKVNQLLPEIANVEVIYRGIDLKAYSYFPYQNDKIVFLFLGGFPDGIGDDGINSKGGMSVLEVWKENESTFFQNNCTLIIGGHQTDRKEVASWHESLEHKELVSIHSVLSQLEVKNLIIQSSIILIPSLAEGLPNMAVESAAIGRTIIGTNVGGIPEVIENNVTGILIPSHNKKALFDAMTFASSSKENLIKLGMNARLKIESDFNNSTFAPKLLAHFYATLSEYKKNCS